MKKILILISIVLSLQATKIKDISNFVGVRDNQLIGYGLIVGLDGTGDGTSSTFTIQSLANMLQSVNIKVNPADIKSKNVAAVMVTAELPAFARVGDKLDVSVASIGDAKSIQGGTLLLTPLKGVDGKIYALSQGAISIGGKNAGGGAGAGRNHPTSGTITNGADVERELGYNIYNQEKTKLSLKEPNFANAVSIQDTLNKFFGAKVATALDPKTISIEKPKNLSMVEFLAQIEDLSIDYSRNQKIVINEKTGTIIAGVDVEVEPIVVTHEGITLKIAPKNRAYPNADDRDIGEGVAVGANNTIIGTDKEPSTIADVARALKLLGAQPKDLISIIMAMKKAGAIKVDVEII